jgi:alpha-ketoglutarate-dependent taurine dioxygenase
LTRFVAFPKFGVPPEQAKRSFPISFTQYAGRYSHRPDVVSRKKAMQERTPIASPEGLDFGCLIVSRNGDSIFDFDKKEVIRLFKKHGALIFRGFNMDEKGADFRTFSDMFGFDFVTYPGITRDLVAKDGTVQTAVKGVGSISLHQEMSYLPEPLCPSFVGFYCQEPPTYGGHTIISDGTHAVKFLSKPAVKMLKSQLLKYEIDFTLEQIMTFLRTDSLEKFKKLLRKHSLQKVFKLKDDGVTTRYYTPAFTLTKFGRKKALMKPLNNFGRSLKFPVFADGSPLPPALYDELEDITDRLTVDIRWRRGDVLLFDNSRIMHGRRTVEDNDRLIFTRFGKTTF